MRSQYRPVRGERVSLLACKSWCAFRAFWVVGYDLISKIDAAWMPAVL